MDVKKVLSIVLILIGLFYAVAPHSVHTSTPLGLGMEHTWHIGLGLVLLLVGVVVWWKGKKPAKK